LNHGDHHFGFRNAAVAAGTTGAAEIGAAAAADFLRRGKSQVPFSF